MHKYRANKYPYMDDFNFSPERISSGILFSSTLWGILFYTYTAIFFASSHRFIGRS
jgi:hypothetical protein